MHQETLLAPRQVNRLLTQRLAESPQECDQLLELLPLTEPLPGEPCQEVVGNFLAGRIELGSRTRDSWFLRVP
jgi:hypothetical protein